MHLRLVLLLQSYSGNILINKAHYGFNLLENMPEANTDLSFRYRGLIGIVALLPIAILLVFSRPTTIVSGSILAIVTDFFGWFLFVPGFYILAKRTKGMIKDKNIDKNMVFIWLTILSSFSVLLWPVVTRVLFITMPAAVLVSSLFLKKIEKRWYIVSLILILYAVCAYLMDAYILDFVNIQPILKLFGHFL